MWLFLDFTIVFSKGDIGNLLPRLALCGSAPKQFQMGSYLTRWEAYLEHYGGEGKLTWESEDWDPMVNWVITVTHVLPLLELHIHTLTMWHGSNG